MMAKLLSICTCLLFCGLLSGQTNYIPYHQKMIDIRQLVIEEEFKIAEKMLLDLFLDYEPKFARDLMLAAQLCTLNKHYYLSLEFLEKSIEKGITLERIKELEVFEPLYNLEKWKSIERRIDRLKYNYAISINFDLAKEFEQRFKMEQGAKGAARSEINEANFKRIQEVIKQYGFPGEHLLGMSTYKMIVTLICHEYSFSLLQEELLSALKDGNLHPDDFHHVYEYEARRISIQYLDKSPPKGITLPKYNIVAFPDVDLDSEKLKKEQYKFGIRFSDFHEKKAVSQKYGIRF